jgi:hypothetical protein
VANDKVSEYAPLHDASGVPNQLPLRFSGRFWLNRGQSLGLRQFWLERPKLHNSNEMMAVIRATKQAAGLNKAASLLVSQFPLTVERSIRGFLLPPE